MFSVFPKQLKKGDRLDAERWHVQLDGSVVETLRERNEARLGIFISMPDIKKPQLIEVRKLRFFQVSRWARLPAAVWERSPVFLPRIYSSRGGKKPDWK